MNMIMFDKQSDNIASSDHNFEVIQAMRQYGGSFVVALAEAFTRADMNNFAKLKSAFPEYWEQYEEMADKKSRAL